jgi:hypothetical protein
MHTQSTIPDYCTTGLGQATTQRQGRNTARLTFAARHATATVRDATPGALTASLVPSTHVMYISAQHNTVAARAGHHDGVAASVTCRRQQTTDNRQLVTARRRCCANLQLLAALARRPTAHESRRSTCRTADGWREMRSNAAVASVIYALLRPSPARPMSTAPLAPRPQPPVASLEGFLLV